MVCVEGKERAEISPALQTELSKLFADNLLTSLTSAKVPRAVDVVKKL